MRMFSALTGVGSAHWTVAQDGRLCRKRVTCDVSGDFCKYVQLIRDRFGVGRRVAKLGCAEARCATDDGNGGDCQLGGETVGKRMFGPRGNEDCG